MQLMSRKNVNFCVLWQYTTNKCLSLVVHGLFFQFATIKYIITYFVQKTLVRDVSLFHTVHECDKTC